MHERISTRSSLSDGNVEKALRKFKKKIQESGLLDELREPEKPTKNLPQNVSVKKVLPKHVGANNYVHNNFQKNFTNVFIEFKLPQGTKVMGMC
jgi:hypothetical protein